MKQSIEDYLLESASVKTSLIGLSPTIKATGAALVECVRNGGRIYTCGNGGSACDAMHFAEELVARFDRERPGIPAQHLIDSGTMTCWANDYSFDTVFRRQVETLATNRDALVVFSTSGNSANILEALTAARSKGIKTVGLLGKGGGRAKALCDFALVVECQTTSIIQESHIALVHLLCGILEDQLYPV